MKRKKLSTIYSSRLMKERKVERKGRNNRRKRENEEEKKERR